MLRPIFKIKNSQKGFTLIEVLAALAILSLISGVAGDTFFSVYRNYNRANVQTEAKQVGQNILTITEKTLRDAVTVTPSVDNKAFTIIKQPNIFHEIGCVEGTTTVNGYIYEKFSSATSPISKLTSDGLIDGVNVTSCNFVVESHTSSPSVRIAKLGFVISQSVGASNRIDFKTSVPFELSVVLRNQ